ncbi:MAG: ABC transporter ATP-binding protein [Lachnospiraceae bacterium]
MNAIEIRNLTKSFEGQVVLSNVNMTVKQGEIYAFLGANGAGKSTLMKLLFDILKPDEGSISLFGQLVVKKGTNKIFSQIGSIIETPVHYKHLTAIENLQIHCDYVGVHLRQEIPYVLELVGLHDAKDKRVGEFSLGMKQRLALARAFIAKPKLLVLDEPINGLDPMGIGDIRDLLLTVNKEFGTAIFISSHIISEIEKIADTIGIIDQGVMLIQKPLEEIQKGNTDLEEYFRHIIIGGRENV